MVGQNQWYHFSGGLVDVHWGYDLDFDPWPYTAGVTQVLVYLSICQALFFLISTHIQKRYPHPTKDVMLEFGHMTDSLGESATASRATAHEV